MKGFLYTVFLTGWFWACESRFIPGDATLQPSFLLHYQRKSYKLTAISYKLTLCPPNWLRSAETICPV